MRASRNIIPVLYTQNADMCAYCKTQNVLSANNDFVIPLLLDFLRHFWFVVNFAYCAFILQHNFVEVTLFFLFLYLLFFYLKCCQYFFLFLLLFLLLLFFIQREKNGSHRYLKQTEAAKKKIFFKLTHFICFEQGEKSLAWFLMHALA